jgi:hypothetical protein
MLFLLCCDISHKLGCLPVPVWIAFPLSGSILSLDLSLVIAGFYLILIVPLFFGKKLLKWALPMFLSRYSWYFLFIQSLMTHLAAHSDMVQASSGPVNGYSDPFLASFSTISFLSIPLCHGTHIGFTPLHSASSILVMCYLSVTIAVT